LARDLVLDIGARLRAQRERVGISARALAREIGVSPSLISQIETGKSRPSVSTLYAITNALEVPVENLFERSAPAAAIGAGAVRGVGTGIAAEENVGPDTGALGAVAAMLTMTDETSGAGKGAAMAGTAAPSGTIGAGEGVAARDDGAANEGGGSAAGLRVLGPDRERLVGPVVQPGEREVLTLDSGVTWERLGQVPGTHVDFLRITYDPGGTSAGNGRLMRHPGVEYGYVVSGELVLTLGFDEYRLTPGDAVSFDNRDFIAFCHYHRHVGVHDDAPGRHGHGAGGPGVLRPAPALPPAGLRRGQQLRRCQRFRSTAFQISRRGGPPPT
jgi:DNA-binding XRE family transcriptional regulator